MLLLHTLFVVSILAVPSCTAGTVVAPLPDTAPSSFTLSLSRLISNPTIIASASKTSSASAQTFTVSVGNGDHKFRPDVIQADVGDTVEFRFYPQNHSVIRAEYGFPCIPYEMTGPGKVGFWSGFRPVNAILNEPPKYTVLINDTLPIFFYCSAPSSCMHQGMVGVINPNATTSLATQRALAQNASYQLSPGESFPSEASPSPGLTSLPPANASADQAKQDASKNDKLSPGAIAGIAIACASVVILGGALAWFWGRFRGLRDEVDRKDSTIVRSTAPRDSWYLTGGSPSSAQGLHGGAPHAGPQGIGITSPPPMAAAPSPPYSAAAVSTSPHAVPPAYYADSFSQTGGLRRGGGEYDRDLPPGTAGRRSAGDWGAASVAAGMGVSSTKEGGAVGAAMPYMLPLTSDMTSPVDPSIVPAGTGPGGRRSSTLDASIVPAGTGPGGRRSSTLDARGLQQWAGSQQSPDRAVCRHGPSGGGYFDERIGRRITVVGEFERGIGPVEMDGTGVCGAGGGTGANFEGRERLGWEGRERRI